MFVNDFYYIVLAFLVTCGDGYQAEVSSSSLFHSQNNHFCDGTSLPVANHPCQPQSQPGRREANLIMKWRPFVHMAANSQPSKHASSFRRVYLQKAGNSEVSRIVTDLTDSSDSKLAYFWKPSIRLFPQKSGASSKLPLLMTSVEL